MSKEQLEKDVQNILFALDRAPMVWTDQVNVRDSLKRIVAALEASSVEALPKVEKVDG